MDVLTLVHGREAHLDNLIAGLERSRVLPERLIVVQMNQSIHPWRSERFAIEHLEICTTDGSLPLAKARNLAAWSAQSNELVFLDVDCIPSNDLLGSYERYLKRDKRTIYQGIVNYLPPGQLSDWSEASLDACSSSHEAFGAFAPGDALPHPMFWSLNFACHLETFEQIGGFDEAYTGYGGEDTDFAFRAERLAVGLQLVDAQAFHQHHPTYSPPLNHFADIVRNATVFHDRWERWPMDGWLNAFEAAGYIEFCDGRLKIRRHPTRTEVEAARCA
ncbi:galactosyltransferase-related protein [Caballeronia sp. LZ043]|uniref:glycosyltransferase family 2 protein n=1 Tax=Caballeronia sp. LZ043 TaxID=3038569 RepID=UPI00285B2D81|nr:galactosyltransferase-related protein [Caballeronia sp. LZ043]MDR5822531.1 galactosyltransferase-related protein [Caballeronia sp. LZ043]